MFRLFYWLTQVSPAREKLTKAPANEAIGNMGKGYQPPVTVEEAFLSWNP